MGRLPDGELSQSSRAIKWRANKTVKNAKIALEKQGATELIIEGEKVMSTEPKKTKLVSDAPGVFTDPAPVEIVAEPDTQAYHCNNCHATVHQGDQACGVCEQRLNWAGIRG
jgi:hypothetical protein